MSARVILYLCLGTLKSPQVLELSGVGNPDILDAAGVNVTVNLTGVGENMMDHLLLVTDFVVNDGVLTLGKKFGSTAFTLLTRITQTGSLTMKRFWLNNKSSCKHFWPFTCSSLMSVNSSSKGQGAFTYASRVTGSMTMQDFAANGTADLGPLLDGLQADLDSRTPTPLQAAQYKLLKNMLDSGDIGFATPIALPRGGASGGPFDPNSNYVTLALFYMHEFSRGSIVSNTRVVSKPRINDVCCHCSTSTHLILMRHL